MRRPWRPSNATSSPCSCAHRAPTGKHARQVMPRPLTFRQLDVLRWIGDGCPPGRWADETHKASARALASRGLAQVGRPKSTGGAWSATLTEVGRYYLDHGRYPAPPPDPPARAAGDVHAKVQRAIRHADGSTQRHGPGSKYPTASSRRR